MIAFTFRCAAGTVIAACLMAAVAPKRATSAVALIDVLMNAADAFVAGAPQHDDMTLLVVRAV